MHESGNTLNYFSKRLQSTPGSNVSKWKPHAFSVRHLQNVTRDENFYKNVEERLEKYLMREFEKDMVGFGSPSYGGWGSI